MKPVSIRFRCFGPYMAEQYIDFRELEKNGLFLICGETGAGKTTILDAMCYALYGRSSGGLRGDMGVMRCKLAGKTDETYVEFIFDSAGKRYQFTRSLKFGRKNLNDSHNCLVLQGEEYIPIFENPKATNVNKKAEELIGLTYDQFRQVIILPQGQFEKLLVSDSAEKEKILVSLFQADRWQRIADELYRRVAERDAALKQDQVRFAAKLREYGCESLEALTAKRQEIQLGLETVTAEAEQAEQVVTRQRKLHTQAALEEQQFAQLRQRELVCGQLEAQGEAYRREEAVLKLAEAAAAIHPRFSAWQDAKNGKLRAENILSQRENALVLASSALKKAKEALASHDKKKPEQEEKRKQLTLLESAREVYETLTEKRSAAEAAEAALAGERKKLEKARRDFYQQDTLWNSARIKQEQAIRDYQSADAVYRQGIGALLAENLTVGQPCPVCGSREHPAPAQKAAGHVTDAQLDGFIQAMNRSNEAVSKAMQTRRNAEERSKQAEAAYNVAAQAAAVAAKDRENAEARKIPGIETTRQLQQSILSLQAQADAYAKAAEKLTKAVTGAEGDLKAAQAGALTAREELSAAQSVYAAQTVQWEQALADSGLENESLFHASDMEPEEKNRRSQALLRYHANLAQAREALAAQRHALEGKAEPDMASLSKALEDAERTAKSLSARKVLEENSLNRIRADEAQLSRQLQSYGVQRQQVDGDLDFANRLRGRSGVSLQRYVLGVMLTSITVQANRLLSNVYGGRYRLYRTDEISGSGHKGGLELEVFDSQNNQRRSVTTLSGGEKFLVALSLAIGLSTVVQAQGSGIRLEAMFIDEGFGSLDRDAVNDALEVLQGIQRSAGVVGIISHVEQLAETIPTRIEITKGRQGSTCRVLGTS